LLQGEFHSRKVTFEEVETTARDFRCSGQVDPFVGLDQVVMGGGFEIEVRLVAVQTVLGVATLVRTDGNIRMQDVGQRHAQPISFRFISIRCDTKALDLLGD